MSNFFESMFLERSCNTHNGFYSFDVEHISSDKPNITWNFINIQDIFKSSPGLEKIISKIAEENKPFLEISCGDCMGLAPLILRCNPSIECLAADIDYNTISGWREFIDNPLNDLQKYHIALARFDNCDMPIEPESLDYITCTLALNYLYNVGSTAFIKALTEIYRVLKKGGCLVALEHTPYYEYDMTRIYQECQPSGILHGLYPFDIIKQTKGIIYDEASYEKQDKHNQFISVGFKIEVYDEDIDTDGIFIERKVSNNTFGKIHQRAKRFYDIYANCNTNIERIEISNRKMKLIYSNSYFGVKCIWKKQLLVLQKL